MSFILTPKIRKEIGKRIKHIRKQRGLSQTEVSVEAGLDSSYYSKIERGEVNPSLKKLYKVIRALGVKSSDILPF